jgi:hypothetical protein
MPYLTCDITGAMSGIEYGKAGDEVEIISYSAAGDMVFVQGIKERFHIRVEHLSDSIQSIKTKVTELELKPVEKTKWKKASNKIAITQQSLF